MQVFLEYLLKFISYILLPFFRLINKYWRFKILFIPVGRFGHLALNTQLFFIKHKIHALDEINYFLITPHLHNKRVANSELLSMFRVYSKEINGVFVICITPLFILLDYMKEVLDDNGLLYRMEMDSKEAEFSLGIKTIYFDKFQYMDGVETLKNMNIPECRKIVTIFARDSLYLREKSPQEDWSYHDYRDCDINTYIHSIQYLIDKGYVVIRIGSEFSKSLEFSDNNYIEYNLSEFKSEFMDLFLIYISDFLIGTTSGATDVAVLFNTPFLGVNYAPFMECPLGGCDLFIQKKIVDQYDQVVPYKGIINKPEYHLFDGNAMSKENLMSYIDNTPEEIYDAVVEMTLKVEKKFLLSAKQKVLLNNYHKNFCSKNSWSNKFSPISIKWLEDNKELYLD